MHGASTSKIGLAVPDMDLNRGQPIQMDTSAVAQSSRNNGRVSEITVGAILLLTGLAKAAEVVGSHPTYAERLTGIPMWEFLAIGAAVETVLAAWLFMWPSGMARMTVALLAVNFIAYHILNAWSGAYACPCLGKIARLAKLSNATADKISFATAVLMLILVLWSQLRSSRGLQSSRRAC